MPRYVTGMPAWPIKPAWARTTFVRRWSVRSHFSLQFDDAHYQLALLEKARHDLVGAQATKAKLEQVLPHYIEQEKAFEKLTKDGFAGRIMYTDKQRERIEKEQDLRTQEFTIQSNRALIEQSESKIAQIHLLTTRSNHR